MNKTTLITLGSIALLGLITIFWWIGISNSEIKLRNRGKEQQNICSTYFDKMWKILQEQASVTNEYKKSFKEIYIPLIEGRYSNDKNGTFMKWIQESNPKFEASLYKDLMASIEGERNGFFIEQAKLIDIDRQHKDMRMTFPNSLVIGSRGDLDIKVIKSLKTEEVYKTGQENDIELF